MTRQTRESLSEVITNVNSVGMPIGLSTMSCAPAVLMLRTVQVILPPPRAIVALFNTLARRDPR
jgi:hypothetical protein